MHVTPTDQDHSTDEWTQNAVATWRYLRVAIVALVAGLFVAVGYEWSIAPENCLQTSLSAYYHTPVHGYFVAALVGVGVCLFCLKGSTDEEDALLNLAGMFAPVVALVPTPRRGGCASVRGSSEYLSEQVLNNFFALLVVVAAGLIFLAVTTVPRLGEVRKLVLWGYAAAVVVWSVLAAVFVIDRDYFVGRAHDPAAISMFVCIVAVVFFNWRECKTCSSPAWARRGYVVIGCAMVLSSAIIVLARVLRDWSHWILVIEVVLILLFAAFWVVQTVELWSKGLRKPMPAPASAKAGPGDRR